jgi:hypothetical protein
MPIGASSGVIVFFALLAAMGAAIYVVLRYGVAWVTRIVRDTWRGR